MNTSDERIVALDERIQKLEGESAQPKSVSMVELFSQASHGTRILVAYILMVAIIAPFCLLFWLLTPLDDDPASTRSLITIVFCMGTMAVAGYLSVKAIRGGEFEKAKEVLIILIGIFGTILGYYFGLTESIIKQPKTQHAATIYQQPYTEPGVLSSPNQLNTTGDEQHAVETNGE